MVLNIIEREQAPTCGAVQAFKFIGNHKDAVTTRPLCRLNHKVFALTKDARKTFDLLFGFNYSELFRYPDTHLHSALFSEHFIVHQWVKVTTIIAQHIIPITCIDTHDASRLQAPTNT